MAINAPKKGLHGIEVPEGYSVRWRDFWSTTYLVDYLFIILLGAASAPFWKSVSPIKQWFSVNDTAIAFPAIDSTLPDKGILVLVFAPVPVLLCLAQLFFRNLHDLHSSILGFLESIALCAVYHAYIWWSLGQMRPNFLAACKPIADGVCSVPADDLVNARHDFPSGHSAFFLCAMLYFALYVWGKGDSFRTVGSFGTQTLMFSILLVAFAIGCTRVADHVHSSWAVIAGFIIGAFFAIVTYHVHYPRTDSGDVLR